MFKFPPSYVPDNSVLALYPPYFPAWTTPLPADEPYDAGIPDRAVEAGLRCVVDPWIDMNVDDEFKLYWDNDLSPVKTITITSAEKDEQLSFRIDETHIVDGDASPVFYTVTRVGGGVERSPQWNLLVKTNRPGGFDDDQGTPGHSGLRFTIPQAIIEDGVDPIQAEAGVPITIKPYQNMRRNDRINLAWGSANVYHTVTDPQVGQEIIITVPKTVIEAAGDGDGVAIAYQVVDVCGNYPGGAATWSAVTNLLVDLGNNRLEAPEVLVDGFPVEEIDLEALAGGDAIVRVYIRSASTDPILNDTLRMTWRGTSAEGSAVIVGPLDLTVERVPFYCDFVIPYAYVAAIAQGRASVNYVRIRSGVADRPSKSAAVTVKGDFRRYAAPQISEAVGSTLEPALNFYTISVPYYAGRNPGDELYIVCEGTTANGSPTYYDAYASVASEAEGAPVLVNLPKAEVQRLDGGSLTLYYSVNGQQPSDTLRLSVGVAAPSLPKPTVTEADASDVLDPGDVNPVIGVSVIVPYTATVADDVVVLRWRGSSTNAPDGQRTLTINTAGKPVPFTVPFTYVSGNLHGTVDVSYTITRGANMLGNSIVRQLRIGAALELTAPSVKEATGATLNPISAKDVLTVVVPANTGLLPSDRLKITWTGAAGTPSGGSYTSGESLVSAGLEIAIPNSVVAFNLGKSVTVSYEVIRGSDAAVRSPAFSLAVLGLGQNDLLTGKPKILQAANNGDGNELDVNAISADVTCWLGTWPHIAAGQDVWLRLKGTKADGTPHDLDIWAPPPRGPIVNPGWVSDGFYTSDARHTFNYLKALRDGSTLTMEFKVDFSKTTDENNAVTFPLRTYTVKAAIAPTLSDIQDSNGSVVGQTTVERSVTVTGTGSSGQQIQLMDGTAVIGSPVTITPPETSWSTAVENLAVKRYDLKARALYGSGQETAVKSFTVVNLVQPTIGSVKGQPSNAEIPHNGNTVETSVTLSGTASAGQEIELFDGTESKGRFTADGGTWTKTVAVSVGLHDFKAVGRYGNDPESSIRSFRVIQRLMIDESAVSLDGFFLYADSAYVRNSTLMPANTTITRTPTQGNPPYSYSSSNSDVASVNSTGYVEGRRNGQASITVTDAYGQTASYNISRSNAWWLSQADTWSGGQWGAEANRRGASNSYNESPPDGGTRQSLHQYYVVPAGANRHSWTGAYTNGRPIYVSLFYASGFETGEPHQNKAAYCRIPYNSGTVLSDVTDFPELPESSGD